MMKFLTNNSHNGVIVRVLFLSTLGFNNNNKHDVNAVSVSVIDEGRRSSSNDGGSRVGRNLRGLKDGNGCCSLDYNNCVDWCGSSYDCCMTCDNKEGVTWLSNGPQGQCMKRWDWCDIDAPNRCCEGLECRFRDGEGYNACLPVNDVVYGFVDEVEWWTMCAPGVDGEGDAGDAGNAGGAGDAGDAPDKEVGINEGDAPTASDVEEDEDAPTASDVVEVENIPITSDFYDCAMDACIHRDCFCGTEYYEDGVCGAAWYCSDYETYALDVDEELDDYCIRDGCDNSDRIQWDNEIQGWRCSSTPIAELDTCGTDACIHRDCFFGAGYYDDGYCGAAWYCNDYETYALDDDEELDDACIRDGCTNDNGIKWNDEIQGWICDICSMNACIHKDCIETGYYEDGFCGAAWYCSDYETYVFPDEGEEVDDYCIRDGCNTNDDGIYWNDEIQGWSCSD